MPSLLINNIQQLAVGTSTPKAPLRGTALAQIDLLQDAYLLIDKGRIVAFGPQAESPARADKLIDASGRMVLPSWCDSHTHIVFAGSREAEFVNRLKGLHYEAIAAKGGGILNSARRLNETPEEVLFELASERLMDMARQGTGAVEIKSGYGLTLEGELKMLRVIQRLKAESSLAIKATFLGAHAFPAEYKQNRQAYIHLIINEMLPKIANEGLADYIDVFCEKIAFSVEETEQVLTAGQRYGLRPKIHTNQFNSIGGIELAIAHNALSVDHLETMQPSEIDALANAQTIAALLPSAPFFLNDSYAPARQLIDKGTAVALATDYNPGSSPSGRMPFVVSLACIKMKMLPEEAINAATINGACAMELEDELGNISVGKRANIFITKKIPSIAYIPYSFGSEFVEKVILNGQEVF